MHLRNAALFLVTLLLATGCVEIQPNSHLTGESAMKWRERAERGETQAQFNLGYLYMTGRGTERNTEQAVYWYRRSAEQGHRASREALEVLDATISSPILSPVEMPTSMPTTQNVNFGDYYALIIGINGYTNLPSLSTPVHDANALAGLLASRYGFNTEVLVNVTRAEIMRAFARYRRLLSRDDNLLVFYAGHGVVDDEAEEGYWLGIDATLDDESTWISNTTLATTLRAMKAKHVLVVSDSCYSGALTRGLSLGKVTDEAALSRLATHRARTALTSGANEPVRDGGGSGHSVFARFFLGALAANEEILDGASLYVRLRKGVMVNSRQSPQYGDIANAGHEDGDFLFVPTSKN
jgi:hypothetical protein